jgi:hypothetical protein
MATGKDVNGSRAARDRVFWPAAAVYLAAGVLYALREHLVAGDAYARVAIAHRILFSRDPHLAAIGFVWSPLPVLALLPLIPLKWLVPAVTDYGFVADVVSALCMAGAAHEVCGLLREIGVERAPRLALTAAFGLHPLIVLYAANGMSEAMFLLFLLVSVRRFARWLRTGEVGAAAATGLGLGAAYLTRYEALFAGAAATGLAAAVSYWRGPGPVRQRWACAVADATVMSLPIAAAFVCWILASWVITGNPMEQFSSSYGNAAQLSVKVGSSPGAGGWSAYAAAQLLGVEPFLAGVVALGALRSLGVRPASLGWRAGAALLAVTGLAGGVLAFMVWSSARGVIDHELRYMILAVPLAVLAAGPAIRAPAGTRFRRTVRAGGAASLLMVVAALPVSAVELVSLSMNPGDGPQVRAIFERNGVAERRAAARFTTERRIAADLDAMRLPPGTVLVDDFLGFGMPLSSRNPGQFAITSDRDFQSILADPAGSGIRFVLVPDPVEQGRLDAVNRRYPSLYANGAGMATLVREYPNAADRVDWRLYALPASPGAAR